MVKGDHSTKHGTSTYDLEYSSSDVFLYCSVDIYIVNIDSDDFLWIEKLRWLRF